MSRDQVRLNHAIAEPRAFPQAVRRGAAADVQHWKIAVVIPAYFAAESIARVIAEIPGWIDAIYVVDDGSIDGTGAAAVAANDRRIQILRHERNRGVGAATVTGYGRAFIDGANIVVKIDSDGQMDPAYLPELIEPLVSGR